MIDLVCVCICRLVRFVVPINIIRGILLGEAGANGDATTATATMMVQGKLILGMVGQGLKGST